MALDRTGVTRAVRKKTREIAVSLFCNACLARVQRAVRRQPLGKNQNISMVNMKAISPILSDKISGMRFLLIAMVVLRHVDPDCVVGVSDSIPTGWQSAASRIGVTFLRGLCSVAAPMFFALSGYLFFWRFKGTRREFLHKWNRRLFSLVLPYLAWSAAYLVMTYLWQSLPFSDPSQASRFLWNMTFREILFRLTMQPLAIQFWFLRDLILLVFLSPVIWYCVRRRGVSILIGLWSLWMLGLFQGGADRTIVSLTSVLFYTFGAWLAIWKIDITSKLRGKRLVCGTWFGLVAIRSYFSLFDSHMCDTVGLVSVLVGILAVWFNYDIVRPVLESRLGKWLSERVFFIYAGHALFLPGIQRRLFGHVWIWDDRSLVAAALVVAVFLIAVWACIAFLTKRLAPPLYTILNGGR